jgi:DNA end-binding protein Ku
MGPIDPKETDMPPRAMWKGAISFGLVTIPVAVYPATEEKSLKFNQLHDEDMGRIRYKRVCSVDGEEVDYEHIVKGYEVEKDRYVVLTDEDLDAVPVESSRAIDIQQFVALDEIDPILFKKSYYLVPDETGVKAYALLRRALSEEGKVGIAKVSFRDKEHLAALRFKDDVFVLETMYWPDEVRAAEFDTVDSDEKVRDNEVEMAKALIENLSEPWNPEQFKDEYREALLDVVERKLAGEPIEAPAEAAPARVVDLMEALKASVAAAKKKTPPAAGGAKRSSAKKSPAKRSAAKSTAKKATASRKRAAAG